MAKKKKTKQTKIGYNQGGHTAVPDAKPTSGKRKQPKREHVDVSGLGNEHGGLYIPYGPEKDHGKRIQKPRKTKVIPAEKPTPKKKVRK